jgi:hypothetical protein
LYEWRVDSFLGVRDRILELKGLNSFFFNSTLEMHLMYYMKDGKRVYTLQKQVDGEPTQTAHPGTKD